MTKGEGGVARGLRLKEVVEEGANLRNGDWKGGDLVGDARVRGNVGFTDRRDAAAMVCCFDVAQDESKWSVSEM